ncbi:MAG: amidohydrolase family protein [Pseudomonadales bacterium]|nr:amidohydrolase family protein [Pseudomonadales bacterium]
MARRHLIVLLPLVLGHGCSERADHAREPVDLILHNGTILTLDGEGGQGNAIAVRGDRIVAVGDERLLVEYSATQTIDLGNRTLLPGFVDSHIHISGAPARHIDLTDAKSVREIRERVASRAAELGPDEWITGYGWSEDALEEQRRPLRDDLDAAAPDNPVVLTRAGAHSAVASSRALAAAEIDEQTPQPEGGVIEKGPDGRLNGIIRERHGLVTQLVPPATDDELRPSLIANLQALFALGITSIVQAADTIEHYPEWERIYAEHRGALPRASVQVAWAGREAMAAFGRKTGSGDEHLKVGAVKLFVDGGFTGPAAFTRLPYKDQGEYRGALNLPPESIYQVIREAHQDGWQLGIHAIGDAAIELAVEALADVLAESPRDDHRHYLNHFTVMPSTETMALMAGNGIAITQQPNFTYTLEGRYSTYLDGERLETNNPLRTPINHGITLALSSDILPIGPLVGLYAAVTRKGMSGREFGPGERLTMLEALRAYTRTGAWLTREEDQKGSLEPGKLADFIVLSDNPLTVSEDEILALRVLQTWLGGQRVFSSGDSDPTDSDPTDSDPTVGDSSTSTSPETEVSP